MSAKYLIFIGICLTNPTLTNLGMGFQKLAINRIRAASGGKSKFVLLWILGLVFQGMVVVLQVKALSIGNASTLGGFAGFGLIPLALFSHFVLKEEISRREFAGLGMILTGTAMLGFFSHGHQRGIVEFEQSRMTVFLIVYALACAGVVFFMMRNISVYGGPALGALGGSLGGLGLVALKIVVGRYIGAGSGIVLSNILADPYTWLAVLGALGSVVLVQFGYKYGKAIQVVPGFSSFVVILPALSGVLVLRESLPLICILSLAVIISGVLVTTTANKTPNQNP